MLNLNDPNVDHSANGRGSRGRGPYAVALLALLCLFPTSLPAQTELRWKFTQGDKLAYATKQTTTTRAVIGGKTTTALVEMGMRVGWQVESVDAQGTATVTQSIEQLSASLKVDNVDPIVYDSTSRSPPSRASKELADMGKALIGAKCTLQISPRGEITSVQPSQELTAALEKSASTKVFTDENVSNILRQVSFLAPQEPVNARAEWETSNSISSPLGKITQTSRYTYRGPAEREGKSLEKIDVATSISLAGESDVELKESNQTGSIWFDREAGRLVVSETKQQLVTERPYREMRIRVTTSTTMEVKAVEPATAVAAQN